MSAYTNYTQFIKDAVALDSLTVRFDCTRPKAGILQMWVPILPQHIWSKISPADAQNKFQNPTPVIGSGPFQVVDWVKDQYVRVVANKNYWGGAPKIDGILFRIYTNQETEAADLQLGRDPVCRRRPGAVSVVRRQIDLDDPQGHRRLLREHGHQLLHAGPLDRAIRCSRTGASATP